MLSIFAIILVAATLAGLTSGLLGVFVIGMRMPFVIVCSSHLALAGAVLGGLFGLDARIGAFAGAFAGAIILSWLMKKSRMDINAALGALFALAVGMVFLGIGLQSGAKTESLSLLWGSLLFVNSTHVWIMAAVSLVLLAFVLVYNKCLKLLLFDRELAALLIPEPYILTALLLLTAAIITINLQIVGGLMLFGLICNPAIAALRLGRTFAAALVWSSALGILSALGGFALSYYLSLPTGACIVLASSLILAATLARDALPQMKKQLPPATPTA